MFGHAVAKEVANKPENISVVKKRLTFLLRTTALVGVMNF